MAEIGLDHPGIAGHLAGRSSGDDAALGQHVDAVAQAHHRLHDMLDNQNSNAARADGLHHRHHVADFGGVEACKHLVEQEQFRFCGQRAGEFKTLAARHRELAGGLIEHRPKPDLMTDRIRLRQRIGPRRMAQEGPHRDVLAHAEAGKGLHDLEGAGDAGAGALMCRQGGDVPALECNRAGGGGLEAGDHREQGGLARAVGADQAGDRSLRDLDRGVVDGDEASEALGDGVDGEKRAHAGAFRRNQPCTSPSTPRGA